MSAEDSSRRRGVGNGESEKASTAERACRLQNKSRACAEYCFEGQNSDMGNCMAEAVICRLGVDYNEVPID